MKVKSKILLFAIIMISGILCSFISIVICSMENVEHTGTITMKWRTQKLINNRCFEIDNETRINVNSYDYYKYSIGDIYTWYSWELT